MQSDDKIKRQDQQGSGGDASISVLVVDDEPMVLRVCRRILGRAGYRVYTAKNAAQAISTVQQGDEPIDVLLCDVVMPDVLGGELATELLEHEPDMEVIFFSGHVGDAEAQAKIDGGSAKFLSKPFVANDLLELIVEVLAPN